MFVYLAADYARKHEMQGCRDVIQALGHNVLSQWIDVDDSIEDCGIGGASITGDNMSYYSSFGSTDFSDIEQCDFFILFTTGEKSRGGRHTEFGMAIALGKMIAIIGPRENVFQCSDSLRQFDTWSDFVRFMSVEWLELQSYQGQALRSAKPSTISKVSR